VKPPRTSAHLPPGFCYSCVYWAHVTADKERGICHRHAPRPRTASELAANVASGAHPAQLMRPRAPDNPHPVDWMNAVWPLTDAGDFCGEYRTDWPGD
jgi:hypothetical protein